MIPFAASADQCVVQKEIHPIFNPNTRIQKHSCIHMKSWSPS